MGIENRDIKSMDRIGAIGPDLPDRIGATSGPRAARGRPNLLDAIDKLLGRWDRIPRKPTPTIFSRSSLPTVEEWERARRAGIDGRQAAAQRRFLTPRK